MAEVNGYDTDALARALYDARKQIGGNVTDDGWARHAIRFPDTHNLLLEEAYRIAEESE